ncbi:MULTISPECIES: zf-HC2 domain-containing protein [unclassified Streptomyces]|uniref:anti-sigma factor n=1 Tax=unclassified Streptomyces TaxID=2593676 RepID=UPI001BE4FA8E|nr:MULTISPECIES: zf-HC2 domain-containing protein [unclassified Streptomyces]MBT2404262.1 zf-HC2 domain-containing protein [Streptomyces sp. ISL-21]MBT2457635.1 zf-HC2 domain-containing protein [Streptomyces sp. ISL-86]MBT2612939.1 zf-HC2 domain-containing protein [Streptomyces sp. ISL-87]
MNRQRHEEEELLGPYVLGVLDDDEIRRVEEHVSGCVQCREEVSALRKLEAVLGEVPEEAFIDGPPQGGDLLLQRTLRQVRGEQAAVRRRRRGLAGLAAAASLAAVFWAGAQLGADDGPNSAQPLPPSPSVSAAPSPVPGTRVASATDSGTGARATVQVTPAAKWVRVHAAVTGIPAGERCRLIVVSGDGRRTTAGGWVVGSKENGEAKGAALDGSAAVDPSDVKEILVENEAGKAFVSVKV